MPHIKSWVVCAALLTPALPSSSEKKKEKKDIETVCLILEIMEVVHSSLHGHEQ